MDVKWELVGIGITSKYNSKNSEHDKWPKETGGHNLNDISKNQSNNPN